MKFRAVSALITSPFLLALPAVASEPLYVKNLSPIAGLLGLPSQRDATPASPWSVQAAVHTSIANHYINDGNAEEFINLDGETQRVALDLRFGLIDNLDLQIEVPWMDHSGGNLDSLIEDWHDLWGMSNGGRDNVEQDLLDYRYLTRDGGFGLQEDASGLGDVSVALNYAFHRTPGSAVTAVVGYKFATGDEDDFLGSGADDVYVALRLSGKHLTDLPLVWHGQLGYLRAGEGDLIEDYQEKDFWFGGMSLDWRIAQRWSLLLQVDAHSAPLDSNLTATGEDAWLITFGGRWRITDDWEVDASVVEDIQEETAPDVTFQLSLRYRMDRDWALPN